MSRKEAKSLYIADGTLPEAIDGCACDPDELLELRVYLDEPELLRKFCQFVSLMKNCFELLRCWADILEFKDADKKNVDLHCARFSAIFVKYIREPPAVRLPDVPLEEDYLTSLRNYYDYLHRSEAVSSFAAPILSSLSMSVLAKSDHKGSVTQQASFDSFPVSTTTQPSILNVLMHKCLIALNEQVSLFTHCCIYVLAYPVTQYTSLLWTRRPSTSTARRRFYG